MKTKWMSIAGGVVLVMGLVAMVNAQTSPDAGTFVDFETLARKLVTQCAGIHEGDLVRITGGVRDVELLENIAVHVRKMGAFPLVTLASDRMRRRMYDDVPEIYDEQTSEFGVKLASMITARIHLDYSETEGALAGVPPERIVTVSRANAPAYDLMLKRRVRQVFIGNDLYPTAERAQLFGVPQEELARIFWNGVNVDYSELQSTGEAVRVVLARGSQVHITDPNGTDLKVSIEDRPVFISDGVISAEDMQRGSAGCLVWLPAGEVFVTPVPGTAEGKVVVERQLFQGKEIKNLTLSFKEGKLTSMKAKSGLEPLKKFYDALGVRKGVFSVIDIGINPNVRLVPDSRMTAWMTAGMITVGIGDNTWAGGENNSPFELYNFLVKGTLKVDGKVLVENGVLKP